MAVPTTQISLEDIRQELLLLPPVSLSRCIATAGKTGVWKKLSDFAGYVRAYCTVSPTYLNYSASYSIKTATVSSNTTWLVAKSSWITVSGASGNGNDTFSITCPTNKGSARTGYVYIEWSGGTRTITIYQESLGDECLQP